MWIAWSSMRIFRSVRPEEVYATGGDNCEAMTLRWMMCIFLRWPVYDKKVVIREELRRVVYMTEKDVTRAGLTRANA